MRVRIVRHDRPHEIRNGHAHYAQMPVRLDATFGRPVARPRHPYRAPRPWRARLLNVALFVALRVAGGVASVLALVILCAFAAGLFYVTVAIARVVHHFFGIGGS